MSAEGTLLALEASFGGNLIDASRERGKLATAESNPQDIRMLEVREASNAGDFDFECVGGRGDRFQSRFEAANFFARNRRAEELQRQMEIRLRDPIDPIVERAELVDQILDGSLDFASDANRNKGANLRRKVGQT